MQIRASVCEYIKRYYLNTVIAAAFPMLFREYSLALQ